jgi:hypothetical protein
LNSLSKSIGQNFGNKTIGTNSTQEGNQIKAIGLLITLEARAGKEADAETFLKSVQPLALDEKEP